MELRIEPAEVVLLLFGLLTLGCLVFTTIIVVKFFIKKREAPKKDTPISSQSTQDSLKDDSIEMLGLRFANGEITLKQFEESRDLLKQ